MSFASVPLFTPPPPEDGHMCMSRQQRRIEGRDSDCVDIIGMPGKSKVCGGQTCIVIPAIGSVIFCGEGRESREVVVDGVACVAFGGAGGVAGFKPGITLCGLDILLEINEA